MDGAGVAQGDDRGGGREYDGRCEQFARDDHVSLGIVGMGCLVDGRMWDWLVMLLLALQPLSKCLSIAVLVCQCLRHISS